MVVKQPRAVGRTRLLVLAAVGVLAVYVGRNTTGALTGYRSLSSRDDTTGAAFVEAVGLCRSFECLRRAHNIPHPGKFNFPHFFIIGYPKCATTSLHAYLEKHPQALGSFPKETQFFGRHGKCWHANNTLEPWGCGKQETRKYIEKMMFRDDAVASGLTRAAFESTTDYSWGDPMGPAVMAHGIRRELPWLKLILSLREPISHEISGRVHTMEMLKKRPHWFRPGPADECLMRLEEGKASMYDCVRDLIKDKEGYIEAMAIWLANWPTEQFMIIQFENLTAEATHMDVLNDVMRFVDIDPSKGPQELPQANSRKGDVNPEGWKMKKAEFLELLGHAKSLSERIAALLERYGLHKADDWLAAWRASWQSNLESCEATGICNVVLT